MFHPSSHRRATRYTITGLLTAGLFAGGLSSAQAATAVAEVPQAFPQIDGGAVPRDPSAPILPPQRSARDATEPAPLLTDLGSDIFLDDQVMPLDLYITPDGRRAFVTALKTNLIYVVDLEQRELLTTIPTTGASTDNVHGNADGTRIIVSVQRNFYDSVGVAIIDTETLTTLAVHQHDVGLISDVVMTPDASSYYVTSLDGEVIRADVTTGAELATRELASNNAGTSLLSPDGATLYVGRNGQGSATLAALDALTLEPQLLDNSSSGIRGFADITFDADPRRLYIGEDGPGVSLLDPRDGEPASRVEVGNLMTGVVGDDTLNRAYSPELHWGVVMAADFNTGHRSESVRDTEVGALHLKKNPATGALVSTNRGSSKAPGSTLTVINRPSVTSPEDVLISEFGEEITLSSAVTGIKRGHGGGVAWQSSTDGVSWTDIDGALGNDLTITVTPENLSTRYRIRFHDDFWGIGGASTPAVARGTAPSLTHADTLAEGIVGEPYPSVIIAANGRDDLRWSAAPVSRIATGLPAGLNLNSETGELSGVPEAAGDFDFAITVTDAFGSDTRNFGLRIAEALVITPPTEKPTAPSTESLTNPTTGDSTTGMQKNTPENVTLAHTGAITPWLGVAGGLALLLTGIGAMRIRRQHS